MNLTLAIMSKDDYKNININDTENIKGEIHELKKILSEIEDDVEKLLGPNKVKDRATKSRAKLRDIRRRLIPLIEKKILRKRQDYESDYS